jgi:pimeloyl-ACP methyl ester carboxylesterase
MTETNFYLAAPYNLYCEHIRPTKVKKNVAIVMIPGAAHTGSGYKVKPDGQPGWAYYFAKQGYEVYVLDWPDIGRSGFVPFAQINGEFMARAFTALLKKINKKVILFTHSMSGPYGWKVAEKIGDQIKYLVAVAPGEMGNIQAAPTIYRQKKGYYDIKMPWGILSIDLNHYLTNDADFINKKLIGQSLLFPKKYLPEYLASLQTRHPVLTYERLNINGSQLKIKNFNKFKKTQVLIINGTHDADHPREAKMKIIDFLKLHQVRAELVWLGDYSLVGNGHMMMLEKNSDKIASLILKKISG